MDDSFAGATREWGSCLKRLTEREALNDEVENAYGFGLTAREWRGSDAIQHSGSDAGFRSHLLMIPEHGFASPFCAAFRAVLSAWPSKWLTTAWRTTLIRLKKKNRITKATSQRPNRIRWPRT